MSIDQSWLDVPEQVTDILRTPEYHEKGFEHVHFASGLYHAWVAFEYQRAQYRLRVDMAGDMRRVMLYRDRVPLMPNGETCRPDAHGRFLHADWLEYSKRPRSVVEHVLRLIQGCHLSQKVHGTLGMATFCNTCEKQLMCLTVDIRQGGPSPWE